MPVMGNGGPIAVPPEQKIEIGQDGTISIRAMGEGPRVMAEVDRIKLVNPDLRNMTKGLDGAIRRSAEHTSELQSLMRISYAVFCLNNTNAKRLAPRAAHAHIDHTQTHT